MQPFDFTTLSAALPELINRWIPARVEQVRQEDSHTVKILLRTFEGQRWLVLSSHPEAARLHFGGSSRDKAAKFPFGATLYQYVAGKVLVSCVRTPWERIIRLRFARRPQEEPEVDLIIEVMGKYSNLILTDTQERILTLAHAVTREQSRVRPLQIGEQYTLPPPLSGPSPSRAESFADWHARLQYIAGPVAQALVKTYRGVSKTLVLQLLDAAGLDARQRTAELTDVQWQHIHALWNEWLVRLEQEHFSPGLGHDGYTVLGWGAHTPSDSVHTLLERYYTEQLQRQTFAQHRQRLQQVIRAALAKAKKRQAEFERMMADARQVDHYKLQADLLMASLHRSEPGLKEITLADFTSEMPVSIRLDPAKDLVANAQRYYRLHRKAKRANQAVEPLLNEATRRVAYLEQVAVTVELLEDAGIDLDALTEVEEELAQEGYTKRPTQTVARTEEVPFHQFSLASGPVVLVGRNNRRNDQLTFQVAGMEDLWFHAQEIPGSHVLLKLAPGQAANPEEIQWAANVAAHFSRARLSKQVPVVYTERKYVRKLKGGGPGLVTYREEQVIWGNPDVLPYASLTEA